MSHHKNSTIIFSIFILVPWTIALFVESSSRALGFDLKIHTFNQIRIFSLWTAVLGCTFLIFRNYSQKLHSVLWYMLPGFFALASLGFIYILSSLSHFGF